MTPVIAAMLLLKVSLLLTVVLALAQVMRRAPAAARHRLWSVAFAALLALPLLGAALPAVAIQMPAWPVAPVAPVPQAGIDMPAAPSRAGVPVTSVAPAPHVAAFGQVEPDAPARSRFAAVSMPAYPALLGGLWLAGAAGAFALLALALWRARRVRRGATVVADDGWAASAHAIALRLGMRAGPRVLMSDRVVTPMAGGLLRPTVFVPPDACAWDAERRDIVLAHEIAHLAGKDPLRQIVARVVLAIYWFHPLAWLAAREAEAAREQACDEAVIALGTRPSTYARLLLDFADAMPASSPAIAALPMIQRTLLEKRLMAILNNDARPRTRRLVMLPALAVTAFTLTVAAAQPATPAAPLRASITSSDISIADEKPATPAPVALPDATAPVGAGQDRAGKSACWWNGSLSGMDGSFDGTMTISDSGGRNEITGQIGRRGATRVMQKTFGDTRVCMLVEGVGDREGVPSSWIGDATRVVLESRRGRAERRLEVAGSRQVWTVDGAERAPDAETASWRGRMLAVLDPAWELSMLRGEESSLRGEISSIHGERSSLQGEISSLHGEVSSMHGEISSIRGEESSLRGEISSIRGELSSMQGELSSERGEISSLNASRYDASDAERTRISERIRRHEAKIAEIQKEIANYDVDKRVAEVERQIARLDAGRKTAEVQRRLNAFDVDKKVREIEAEIARLDVNGQVAAIERKITALNADARAGAIEARLAEAVRALNR